MADRLPSTAPASVDPSSAARAGGGRSAPPAKPASNIKETLTQIVLSFAMAFTFRGFVLEAFVIPTGSMAPTLLGQHTRHVGDTTGSEWVVGPTNAPNEPVAARQTASANQPFVDPMSNSPQRATSARRREGDRLFVIKYIDGLYDPARWHVPVFKVPTASAQNYIKRLIGVPNEQLALVDGDVFVRPTRPVWNDSIERWMPDPATGHSEGGVAAWEEAGWSVARKPERVQRAVWQTVFDAGRSPVPGPSGLPPSGFRPPWAPASDLGAEHARAWSSFASAGVRDEANNRGVGVYEFTGASASAIEWVGRQGPYYSFEFGLTDQYPINYPSPRTGFATFPVADVAVSFGVRFEDKPAPVEIQLAARGMGFVARVEPAQASLIITDEAGTSTTIGPVAGEFLRPGRATHVEAWHVDQTLWLFIDGRLVLGGFDAGDGVPDATYELTPGARVAAAMGRSLTDLFTGLDDRSPNPLARPDLYDQARAPRLRVSLGAGPASLHGLTVRRDIHYQAVSRAVQTSQGIVQVDAAELATRPGSTPTLGPDHFMLCGDNSPNSLDSRRWNTVDPAVAEQLERATDPLGGVVHRRLLVGNAFVVYLPSPRTVAERTPGLSNVPMVDFGRTRWVW